MIATIDLIGLIISFVLFAGLLVPVFPMYFKRLYYKVNRITLVTQRRLYFSLLDGVLLTSPTILFVLHNVLKGKNPFFTFVRHYLPLAAYVFFPIIIAWIRPLAANPLDLWDFLLVAGLIVPIIVQIVLEKQNIFFDQSFTSAHLWIDFHSLYLVVGSLAIFTYTVLRPLPDVGLGKEMRLPTLWDGLLSIIAMGLLIAVLPILVYTDHAFDKVTNIPPIWVFVNFLLIFIFVALPLELIFRGVIQNLFHARIEVIRDVRKYTTDSDTSNKIGRFNFFRNFYDSSIDRSSSSSSMTHHSLNSGYTSTHQYHQTQELLELSLQLGAPAQAQMPLQPGDDKGYSSLERPNDHQSFEKNHDSSNGTNFHIFQKSGKNTNTKKSNFLRQDDRYRESLLQSPSHDTSIDQTNPIIDDFEPEPLFPHAQRQSNQYYKETGSQMTQNGQYPSKNTPNVPKGHFPKLSHDPSDPNAYQLATMNGTDPTETPRFEASVSGVSSKHTKSVLYAISSKNGTATTVSNHDIKDTTSKSLGIGYVSKQDAHIAVLDARDDYLMEMEELEGQHYNNMGTNEPNYDQNDQNYSNYHQNGQNGQNVHIDDNQSLNSSSTSNSRFTFFGAPKVNHVAFDKALFRSKQRGFGTTFEESPVWPTWQERHASFYSKSFFRWFLLPTKTDYICTLLGAIIYAGALTYNIGYFIQHAQRDGQSTPLFESYTWFTLFAVLFWQGFLCGFLWRMSSQIWPSVLVTASFFTLGAYWLGIDG